MNDGFAVGLLIAFALWLFWWVYVVGKISDTVPENPKNGGIVKTLWILIVTAFPFLGLILWHWVGRGVVSGNQAGWK